MLTRRGAARAALGLGAALPVSALAQGAWPDRPLRLIIGYPPGGASDTFGRIIAQQMAPRLGQSVVVENRAGGGGVVAAEAVARSGDGHTILHVDNGIIGYNPALYARLPYDPDRDLTGVGFIGRFPLFLVVRPDSPVRDLAGYVAASRQRAPTYGTPAVASPHHLAMEYLKRRVPDLQATHVPYRGGPAAMQDLLAGNVDSVVIDCATGTPFIRDNRVRALVVLSEGPAPSAPEVPTIRSLGHDAVAYGWQGLAVPAGTPAAVVERLSTELNRAIASEEMRSRFATLGIESAPMSPAAFAEFIRQDNAVWRPLIRELGIRLDA